MDVAGDLLGFVDAGVSPFHVVAEMRQRLEEAGFQRLDERERWALAAGDRRYVVRDGSSVIAFRVGAQPPSAAGFRMVAAHTDSPGLKVRPRADVSRAGYRLIGVEPYGSPLLHTWLDRDLTLAGRVAVRAGDGQIRTLLARLPGAPLRVPSLAIHLHREVRTEGLKLDPQRHMVPVWSAGADDHVGLRASLAEHLGVAAGQILGHDLYATDTQPASLGGAGNAFVFAPRLDNLASCHTGLHALLGADTSDATQVLACSDHEEVGSASAEGAAGPFLHDALRRLLAAVDDADSQAFATAAARSLLVSADMAHAVHPNHVDRHDPEHRPILGGGPVLKLNAGQSYATDAVSGAWFAERCADAGVPLQHFATRADLPCGSTIGPLAATRLGIQTVDVGAPLLSMHSVREQAAAADVEPMVVALSAHYSASDR